MKGNKHRRRQQIYMKQNGHQISMMQKKNKQRRGKRDESMAKRT